MRNIIPKKCSLSRRNFVKGLIGAAVAAFSASSVAVALKFLWPLGPKVEGGPVKIAKTSAVPLKTVMERWRFKGFPAILIHDDDGFRAFAVKCTHLGCTAQWREHYSGYANPVIFCPCHDGVFDSKTAAVLAGPPPSPLPAIKIEDRSGTMYAIDWEDPVYEQSLAVYKV